MIGVATLRRLECRWTRCVAHILPRRINLILHPRVAMSKPKIVYFAARGRAELARIVLAAANVEWDEEHLTPETLGELKASGRLPYGQVPLLVDGDVEVVQSMAIVRYLARKYNVYGDLKQSALGDVIVDGWCDLLNAIIPLLFPQKNEEAYEEFKKDKAPGKIADFERIVEKNLGDGPFLGGASPVLADLALFLVAESTIDEMKFVAKEDAPQLYALKERVAAVPGMAAYIASEKRHPARKD